MFEQNQLLFFELLKFVYWLLLHYWPWQYFHFFAGALQWK